MSIVVDLAGGDIGGMGRFREQYFAYLTANSSATAVTIGARRNLSAPWLLRREALARGADKAVATNNASFLASGSRRWTLLHNANQFLSSEEWARAGSELGRAFAAQSWVVRRSAVRSETLVVPSTSMADRVASALPGLADRIVVRFQPLTPLAREVLEGSEVPSILCPIVNSPYKRLVHHLEQLQAALSDLRVRVVCTLNSLDASAVLRGDPRFDFVGVLNRHALATHYLTARAIYFPTSVESFGYPLAEGRSAGVPVIAQDTSHNREIAGRALAGFIPGTPGSLTTAVEEALSSRPEADPGPFARDPYFDWLLA